MNKPFSKRLLKLLGMMFSILPALIATLTYFPVWQRDERTLISGVSLLLLLLAFTPLFNFIKEKIRTPSSPIMWFIIFVCFFALSSIAREITVISFYGFLGNLVGLVFFRLSERGREEK